MTGENGQFTLRDLPAGTQTLDVRLLGYSPARRTVALRSGDTTRVEVGLERVVVLREVRVDANLGIGRDRLEFEQRRRMGFGHFLGDSALQRMHSTKTMLYEIPGLRVQSTGAFLFVPLVQRPAGWCEPALYIDKFPAAFEELASYPPEELVGLEVYTRPSTAPPGYSLRPVAGASGRGVSGSHEDCGVILVWTRQARW
ncbi:MAG: carboxypeptidase-like regulatory domain-containing protein [Gemmatimonadaceae bacterium]